MFASKVLLIAVLLVCPGVSRAAVYNFYFNNTEQGAGSTASPTVVVKDGQVVAPAPGAAPAEEEEEAAPAAPAAAPVAVTPVVPPPTPETKAERELEKRHRRWRFGLHLSSLKKPRPTYSRSSYGYSYNSPYGNSYGAYGHSDWDDRRNSASTVSATFLPSPYLGFSLLAGAMTAFETEINLLPSNAPLGLSVVGGYGKTKESKSSAFHGGFVLGLDLGDLLGMQLGWRSFGGEVSQKITTLGAYLKF